MSFWTAVVIIVAIGAFTNLRKARYESQTAVHRQPEPARMVSSQRETELQREVEDLRERVRVLERIATDGRITAQLADEIESLRDTKN